MSIDASGVEENVQFYVTHYSPHNQLSGEQAMMIIVLMLAGLCAAVWLIDNKKNSNNFAMDIGKIRERVNR